MLHTHSLTYHPRYILFLSQHFSFPLSVSFHQCSMLICILFLLLAEGQAGRNRETLNKATLLWISVTSWQKSNCTLFGTFILFTYTFPSSVRLLQRFSRFTASEGLTINPSNTQDTDHCPGPEQEQYTKLKYQASKFTPSPSNVWRVRIKPARDKKLPVHSFS